MKEFMDALINMSISGAVITAAQNSAEKSATALFIHAVGNSRDTAVVPVFAPQPCKPVQPVQREFRRRQGDFHSAG